jgi:hypothetical protein
MNSVLKLIRSKLGFLLHFGTTSDLNCYGYGDNKLYK